MRVFDLLTEATWKPYGLKCSNEASAHLLHKFLREAVMDRHICLSKVIGFSITTIRGADIVTPNYIARAKEMGDSYPELMVNMLDKVFLDENNMEVVTTLNVGDNLLPEVSFGDLRDYKCSLLYTNPRIGRCLSKKVNLKLRLAYDSGYRDMSTNSKELGRQYFPCYTDYCLSDYVRILPMLNQVDQTIVPIRFYNGCTAEIFMNIINKWFIHINTGQIKEEDNLWLQLNFGR